MTDNTMCVPCARGFIDECLQDVPCKTVFNNIDETNVAFINNLTGTGGSAPVAKKVGRPIKENAEDIKDPQSTGRKRAATLYPLNRHMSCEWQGYINCGGGKYPIAGCTNGLQENIHHGPDKNTLNNERHNIHLICAFCHNTWHGANDPEYDDTYKTIPHSPIVFNTALDLLGKYSQQKSRREEKDSDGRTA